MELYARFAERKQRVLWRVHSSNATSRNVNIIRCEVTCYANQSEGVCPSLGPNGLNKWSRLIPLKAIGEGRFIPIGGAY